MEHIIGCLWINSHLAIRNNDKYPLNLSLFLIARREWIPYEGGCDSNI